MEINFKLKNQKVLKYLVTFYGIGSKRALRFHKIIGLNSRLSSFYVTSFQKKVLVFRLSRLLILQKLKKYIYKVHDFAYKLRSRKGIRNRIGLPSRGQKTKSNGKTKKKIRY